MRFTSTERTHSLLRMLSLDDEDLLLKEIDNIGENGGIYALNREKYLLLANNEVENDLLVIHDEISNRGGPMHIKIADLILFDERGDALDMISGPLVKMHKDELQVYTQLYNFHMLQGHNAIEQNKINYNRLVTNLWIAMSVVFLISIAILLFILRIISKNEQQQRAAHDNLESSLQLANNANKAKSRLLSNMSHELRTPLHAIMGFTDIVTRKNSSDEKITKYTQRISKASTHLLALVDDALDLSKIESGKLKFDMEKIELNSVLAECRLLIEPIIDQTEQSLIFDDNVNYTVEIDKTRLKQALLNILSNAVKYNSFYGCVTVTYENMGNGYLRINITDDGSGLSPDQEERLFVPFERLGAESSTIQGTGIGLTITKQLIVKMGGQIGVYSNSGQGTTIWIEIILVS